MRKPIGGFLAAVVLLALPVYASTVFTASLDGSSTGSPGSGFGTATISDDLMSLSVSLDFSGLEGDATAASLSGFPLTVPFGTTTSGSLSGFFSIATAEALNLEDNGGTFSVSSTAFPGGEISGSFPGTPPPPVGSAPDQLPRPIGFPVLLTPEPAVFALVAMGLAMLVLARRWVDPHN